MEIDFVPTATGLVTVKLTVAQDHDCHPFSKESSKITIAFAAGATAVLPAEPVVEEVKVMGAGVEDPDEVDK
jgi:hypothetical protein